MKKQDVQKVVPDPNKHLRVIKRYLHVLSLIQNNKDPYDWNGSTLADHLSLDEEGGTLSDKNMRDYIQKDLVDKLGIDINVEKGARRIELNEPIPEPLLKQLALVYSSFVTTDSTKEMVIKNLISKHPHDCLWMMARIYFAIIEKKKIKFNYITNKGDEIKDQVYHPYHMVFRNNNLYLVARPASKEKTILFIFNRVSNLNIMSEFYEETVPGVDEIFKNVLGSYIGDSYRVKIKFKKEIYKIIEQFLGYLEPEILEVDDGNYYTATFDVADAKYLCKQLFLYEDNVEILEPVEVRGMMIEMIEKSMSVYE